MHPTMIWLCLTDEELEHILALITARKADAEYRGHQVVAKEQSYLLKKLAMFRDCERSPTINPTDKVTNVTIKI